MAGLPGQQLVKILGKWDGPFPEESASLQRLTDLVNKIVDVIQPNAGANNNPAQQGDVKVIGANVNGQPMTMNVLIVGAPASVSGSLNPGTGNFVTT